MPQSSERLAHELLELISNDGSDSSLLDVLYDLIDRAKQLKDPSTFLSATFTFFEERPELDIGSPGPLVYFVETFYPDGYEPLLLESLDRRPVPHTVWMANRLLNDPAIKRSLRVRLIAALESAVIHPRSTHATREDAKQFLDQQRS